MRALPALPTGECGTELRVDPMPSVVADDPQLPQLLSNPIANAMTYRHPDRPPRVEISAVLDDGARVVVTLPARSARPVA